MLGRNNQNTLDAAEMVIVLFLCRVKLIAVVDRNPDPNKPLEGISNPIVFKVSPASQTSANELISLRWMLQGMSVLE